VFPESKKADGDRRVLLSAPIDGQDDRIISWPGEYDYDGIAIRGIGQKEGKQVSYVVTTENIRFGFVSSPLCAWNEHEIELLGDLDVLVVPAEDVKKVQAIVEEVDPPVVIPLRTKDAAVYQEVVAACGGKETEPVKEVSLKKSTLPTETREVYVLEES